MRFLHDHSLSLAISVGWLVFTGLALVLAPSLDAEFWTDLARTYSGDMLGILALVMLTKSLRERGSKESK